MNIKQVKEKWTLETLLRQLGYFPDDKKSRGHDLWFCSPFRNEATPSMHIDIRKDIWMDFGLASESKSGGDLIYFAQVYLRHQGKAGSISDVLEWFSGLSGETTHQRLEKPPQHSSKPRQEAFKILSIKPIFTLALFDYLEQRKIEKEVAMMFLEQIYFIHLESGTKRFGLGMKNNSGGYDIRNPLGFKSVIGAKDISYFESPHNNHKVLIFEGSFDFLSWASLLVQAGKSPLECSAIVMHTNRLFQPVASLIKEKGINQVELWLDNDAGGEQGANAIKQELIDHSEIEINSMNHKYKGYKDVNAWHVDLSF